MQPFIDALLSVFLVASTIGGVDGARGELPAWLVGVALHDHTTASFRLMYLVSIVSLAAFSVTFVTIQRHIESRIGGYEFAFTQKVGQIERVISGQRLDVVEEEEAEDVEFTINHVFKSNNNKDQSE